MAGWFIWHEGEIEGPLGSEELARRVLDGAVGAQDWLWHADLGAWTRAGSFDFVKRQLPKADHGDGAGRASAQTERMGSEHPDGGSAKRGHPPHVHQHSAQQGRVGPMPEISLTKLYLARLKHEPLARLAVEAATIEAVAQAEANQPFVAEPATVRGSDEDSGPDLLAERLATLLGSGSGPSDTSGWETPAWETPAWETVALNETGWDGAGSRPAAAGSVPSSANATAAGIAAGRPSDAAQPSTLPNDIGIHVMRQLPAE